MKKSFLMMGIMTAFMCSLTSGTVYAEDKIPDLRGIEIQEEYSETERCV